MVPRVCRKWGIPFSLVETRTEIWKFYFGRTTYITPGVSTSCATLGATLDYSGYDMCEISIIGLFYNL